MPPPCWVLRLSHPLHAPASEQPCRTLQAAMLLPLAGAFLGLGPSPAHAARRRPPPPAQAAEAPAPESTGAAAKRWLNSKGQASQEQYARYLSYMAPESSRQECRLPEF
jgi:hypothetical protein